MVRAARQVEPVRNLEKIVKRTLSYVVVALFIGAIGAYAVGQYRDHQQQLDLMSRLHTMEQTLSETKIELIGYTRYTDYLSTTKKAMTEQAKFIAAKVDREYVHVEHIERSKLLLKSEATIILKYAVEYSVGFELRPDDFSIGTDTSGLVVTLKKPKLVASPAVKLISHEIPSKGMLIDEKNAVIELQQQLHQVAEVKGQNIAAEEAVIALCEKSLTSFLRDFLSKQPNVKVVPAITIKYL
jgi:hypothetical protein